MNGDTKPQINEQVDMVWNRSPRPSIVRPIAVATVTIGTVLASILGARSTVDESKELIRTINAGLQDGAFRLSVSGRPIDFNNSQAIDALALSLLKKNDGSVPIELKTAAGASLMSCAIPANKAVGMFKGLYLETSDVTKLTISPYALTKICNKVDTSKLQEVIAPKVKAEASPVGPYSVVATKGAAMEQLVVVPKVGRS